MPSFANAPIEMVLGKTKKFRFSVTDKSTGAGVDITGWPKFWFTAKTNVTDSDGAAVVSKTLGAGITVITLSPGVLEVLIVAADTAALADSAHYLWAEIQGLDNAGLVWSLWQGELAILPRAVVASS